MPLKCPFCGHIWKPKVANPRSCPKCKRYPKTTFERVTEEMYIPPERLTAPKIKVRSLPEESYLECDYCPKRAIVRAFGHNVCEEHLIALLKRRVSEEAERKVAPPEGDVSFEEYLRQLALMTTDFEVMVDLAKQEAIRRNYYLPETEVRRLCEQIWESVRSI